jgi:hypothetical protein
MKFSVIALGVCDDGRVVVPTYGRTRRVARHNPKLGPPPPPINTLDDVDELNQFMPLEL